MLIKLKNYLFKPRFHFNRLQLNLFALVIFSAGAIFGVYYLANSVVLPKLVAADSPWRDTDWSSGEDYSSKSNVDNTNEGYVTVQETDGWDLEEWLYRREINFEDLLDEGFEEETDFPVPVKLEDGVNIDYSKVKNDGSDIRFVDSEGNLLSYEIDIWDNSGDSFLWVVIPLIESGDPTYLYMYYGNESAEDPGYGADIKESPCSGGDINTGDVYYFHEFYADSTFSCTSNVNVDVIVVAGGGGGGYRHGGGGGGGGVIVENDYSITADEDITVAVGEGGSGATGSSIQAGNGENSVFDTLEAIGGGGGGQWDNYRNGRDGGSGGGSTNNTSSSGTADQGNDGGINSTNGSPYNHGGGGGAGEQGGDGDASSCGDGGEGLYVEEFQSYGNDGYFGGGGGAGSHNPPPSDGDPGFGGKGGGGNSGDPGVNNPGVDGTDYTGGGGGAASTSSGGNSKGGDGGNGVVIVRVSRESGNFLSPDSEEDKYLIPSTLVSNIFNSGHPSDWGQLTYTISGTGTVEVEVRTADAGDAEMTETAADWSECDPLSSGVDLSDTDCVDDEDQYIQYKLTLEPDGEEAPNFEEITIAFQASDQTDPEVQASNSKMYTANGGTEITDADEDEDSWINDSIPYFSWTEGEDDAGGSGMLGYCLYLGTSSDGDPRTSKGVLGTSPESTAGTDCEGGFIISTNEVDFTTSSYRGSNWLSSNGSYYLNITAIDNSGNAKGTPFESFHFQYDGTNPTNPSGLSAPQTYQSQIENITIYWATTGTSGPTDDDSGVAGYQYRIGDTGTWYGSGHTGNEDSGDLISAGFYTLNTDHDELSEGENTFYLRTWDNAGNVADSAISAILKYSGNAPSEPNELAVTPATNDENSFGFSWSTPTTYDGQTSGLSYCYTINAVPSSTNCTWTSETSLDADAYATQPSTNTLYVVAKDEAGNVNYDAYASVNFDCDTSAPGVPRNMDIADISIKATSNWKLAISWDPPEATGAGVTSYKIYRSITANADCSSDINEFEDIGTTGGTSYSDADLSQTDYYYCAKACDSANNCSAVSSTVTGYPDGKFTEPAGLTAGPTVSGVTTKKATISWSTDRTADSKIQYGTDSGDYFDEEVSSSTHTTDHSITLTNLSAGQTYYYRAKWTDEDGNTGMSEEKSFTTDPAPTVSEVEVTNIGLTTALINFTVSGASQVKIYYGETTSYGGLSEVTTSTTESSYSVQLTGLADGTKYYFKINAFDSEEEEYENQVNDFETLPRPRISQVRLEEITGSAQPAVLVSWQTNTSISSILTYYPTDNPGQAKDKVNIQLKQGEHRMLLKDLLPDKTYVLVVKGRDKVGNEAESDQQTFTTATDTRPPVIGNLKVEGTIQGTGEEAKAQLLVSFNTDEPATSQVEFGEGTGTTYSQKTQEDADLTNNHLVIVPNLSPSKVYHLRAIAKDKAGNETKSVDTVSITPKATESALNLVITNLSEVFGFLSQSRP